MTFIVIAIGLSLLAIYASGFWAGSRPVRGLREAKDRADKRFVDALLERDGAQEYGDAMAAEARGQQKRADVLEYDLLQAKAAVVAARNVGRTKPAKKSKKAGQSAR